MKNPLRKRLLRELRQELGKYAVIFLLLTVTIGFISGFLVATGSMMAAYDESFEVYNIEDGYFQLQTQADDGTVAAIEELGVTLYDNFYIEESLTNDSTLRIFATRDTVNLVCVMDGALPAAAGEIAIDRMYAENNGIAIGDTIGSDERTWTVTGLVALPDYSSLFSDNSDTMFDAVKFGVAVVCAEEFAGYGAGELTYRYSWKYDTSPESDSEAKAMAEDFLQGLTGVVSLQAFVPCYLNQAIQYVGDDMGTDSAMMKVLLYILIAIMAIVIAETKVNAITRESTMLGSLRASGFPKGEHVRHYMAMPVVVTLISALLGNLLGYTYFKGVCAGMYYGSYSLPTYVTRWSMEAFCNTTAVPLAIMVAVNFVILRRTLTLSPQQFLRRDLGHRRQKRAFPLPSKLRFAVRFRVRVILQNVGSYAILLVGILLANLLLIFGLALPSILSHYEQTLQDNLISAYQYFLQVPLDAAAEDESGMAAMLTFQYAVQTDNADAEAFSAYSLVTIPEGESKADTVTVYGIGQDSRYVAADVSGSGVVVSSAYADKYSLSVGDSITLKEEYDDTTYTFIIDGVYDYEGGVTVFMAQDALDDLFELGEGYFSGYFSDTEITDIDEEYIATVITLDTLTKICRQMDVSMGSMMYMIDTFAVVMIMVLSYLMSRIIIEKNSQSISMAKILGYTDREIAGLFILPTSIVTVVLLLASLPAEKVMLEYLYRTVMMAEMTGWITFYLDPIIYVKMIALGVVTYGVIAWLEYRKIKKVPMDIVLKNVE